jgi:probable F420-dependent oxidoreductase
MSAYKPFRFGVISYNVKTRDEWKAKALRAEELGYSTLLVPDHLGEQLSPFLAMLSAAEATSSLRVGSYVVDNDFRHPAMLAKEAATKEAATLDILSQGRFELGIGAGWQHEEYEQIGISFEVGRIRVDRLEESIHILKGLFAEKPYTFAGQYYRINNLNGYPKPYQKPHPPILLGGGSKRILSIAAREANIVSLAAKVLPDGSKLDTQDISSAATKQKLSWIRQAAGDRFDALELNAIIFFSTVTEQRQQIIQQIAQGSQVSEELISDSPHCLIGTVDHICENIQRRREEFGISYISIFESSMEAFAPVVARLTGK